MARYLSGLVRSSSSSSYHAVSLLSNSPLHPHPRAIPPLFYFYCDNFPREFITCAEFHAPPLFPFFFSSPRLENFFEVLQGVEGKGLLCGLCKWKERFDVISFFLW